MKDKLTDYSARYRAKTDRLLRDHDREHAMGEAVGGSFDAVGQLEYDLLIQLGLERQDTLVDIGCGSGRLAVKLTGYLEGGYLGTDVVPDLLEYAAQATKSPPNWRFVLTDSIMIPAANESADMVCFFSVFTHLTHNDTYRFLNEARRVLKPGGRVVFSFLEFRIPSHWTVFEQDHENSPEVLNQFVSRDAIGAWANHAGLEIQEYHDGDKPFIQLSCPIEWAPTLLDDNLGALGQSPAG